MDSIFIELFDHKSYKNKNIDLQSPSFNDRFHCFNHYINNGIKENRPSGFPNKDLTNKCIDYYSQNLDNSNKFYQSFNSSKYYNQHSDLKARMAFQNNKKLCWNHFVFYGWTENRLNCFNNPNLLQEYINLRKSLDYVIYFSLFDDIKYKNDNPQIDKNPNKQNYWDHFQRRGYNLKYNKNYFKYEFLKDRYIEKRKVRKLVMLPDNNNENLSKLLSDFKILINVSLPTGFKWKDYKSISRFR